MRLLDAQQMARDLLAVGTCDALDGGARYQAVQQDDGRQSARIRFRLN